MSMIYCPTCGRSVSSRAASCPGCGEPIARRLVSRGRSHIPTATPYAPQRLWSPGIAAVLSFLIPGLGQIYKRQILGGIVWMILVPAGYFFLVVPGAILHLFCILGASMGDPTRYR